VPLRPGELCRLHQPRHKSRVPEFPDGPIHKRRRLARILPPRRYPRATTINANELRLDSWASLCRQSQAHASITASLSSSTAWADLIREASQKLHDQLPPDTNDELSLRYRQKSDIHLMIFHIVQADEMTTLHPSIVQQVYDLARTLVHRDLPRTDEASSLLKSDLDSFSSKLSSLCEDDRMRETWR